MKKAKETKSESVDGDVNSDGLLRSVNQEKEKFIVNFDLLSRVPNRPALLTVSLLLVSTERDNESTDSLCG
jgi:hypothetical protein